MKQKIKKCLFFWPELLILLSCAILLSVVISEKRGYHQDELLSFELSNAEFNPWIVPTQPQGRLAKYVDREIRAESAAKTFGNIMDTVKDVLKNKSSSKLLSYQADVYPEPVWIDRETFLDYVTVNERDDFNYLSVYFNVKDDNHPPLYFMVLHTVSSLFREKLSPVMGCAANLLFVLGVMIVIMRLGRICMALIGKKELGRIAGAGAAAIYGLSAAAASTTLLIRMYALLTFFCMLLLLLHLEKLFYARLSKEKVLNESRIGFERKNKLLILVTVLGFWTQYFFLFYCLTLAATVVFILFREKRTGELLRYVISMVTAAVIGLAGFPFAIGDVFSSGRGVEALESMKSGFGEFFSRILVFLRILGTECGMPCIFILVLINFSWGFLKLRGIKLQKSLLAVLLIPAIAYFLCAAKLSPFLVDRYVMPLFPLLIMPLTVGAVGCLSYLLEGKTKKLSAVMAVFLACLALSQPFMPGHWDNEYLYPEYGTQEEVAKENAGLPCICVYEGVRYYENLPEFLQYDRTLLVTMEELKNRMDRSSIEELSEVAVLLKNKNWVPETGEIMKSYGFIPKKAAFVSASENGDLLLIFAKDQN